MVRETNMLGKMIGVCLALRTLHNPKTLPRFRKKATNGASIARHVATTDHAGIDVEDVASQNFSSSGGRVNFRGGCVESRANAEDTLGIGNRRQGEKDVAHELRQSDFRRPGEKDVAHELRQSDFRRQGEKDVAHELRQSDFRRQGEKPGTKGFYLAMQNYHTAKLVQVRHRFFVAKCLGDPTLMSADPLQPYPPTPQIVEELALKMRETPSSHWKICTQGCRDKG